MYKIVHRRLLIPDPEIVIIMYTLCRPVINMSNKNIHEKQRLIVVITLL